MPKRAFFSLPKPRWAFGVLFFIVALALLRDLLANDLPLFCKTRGESFFPAFRSLFTDADRIRFQSPLDSIATENAWKTFPFDAVVFAPIPFKPGQSNAKSQSKPPFFTENFRGKQFRHWLGTSYSGHDVAAGMVAGARVAVLTGLVTMGLAGTLGLLLGGIAGYFGDDRLRLARGRFWAFLAGLPFAFFFAFVPRKFQVLEIGGSAEWLKSAAIFFGILLVFNLLGGALSRVSMFFFRRITVPADFIIMRLAEVFKAVPTLIVIVAVAAVSVSGLPPLLTMVAIIGLFAWHGIARLLRGELLKIRELEYVQAARALGLPDWRILLRHALPNAVRPVLTAFALGVAGSIMLEASLAFLGFTGGQTGASWGGLLHESRNYLSLWWVAVFPGAAIFATVFALNSIAEKF